MRKIVAVSLVFSAAMLSVLFSADDSSANPIVSAIDSSGTRTLILLRHAKSDKSNMSIPDISRPLEESGRKEAEEMGEILAKEIAHVDLIVSSPSLRTRQTLEIICKKIGYAYDAVQWDSSLYACSGDHLLARIRQAENVYKTVMFVGHNPSITDAANALQTKENIIEVKTCGVVTIDFVDCNWADVSREKGNLRFYIKPN